MNKRKLTKKEIWKYSNLAISILLVILLLAGIGNDPLKNLIFQFIAATYVQYVFGFWVYKGAFNEWFRNHSLGMNTLVTLGTVIPYLYSLYLACETWMGHEVIFDPFFSAGASIVLIVSIGESINFYFQQKLTNQINDLNNKKAENANLILANNDIKVVPAKTLNVNDLVIVKKGEIVPADGILVSDNAVIDESMFNGEINYSEKNKNDNVYGGSINTSESFELKISNTYKDSMINQLIKKAQRVQGAKLGVSKKLDKIAVWFTPIMILLAIMFFLIQYYVGYALPNFLVLAKDYHWAQDRLAVSIYYAIAVLVGACPCVFGIAIPMVVAASSGKFLKHGILLNKGKSFDSIKKINAIAFDKTGTITEGKFKIHEIIGNDSFKPIFYALSILSNHPLSLSFVKETKLDKNELDLLKVSDFKEIPGTGLAGIINNDEYKIVNYAYLEKNHIQSEITLSSTSKPLVTFSYLLKNEKVVLEVQFIDSIKTSSYEALKELKAMGYKLFLITGDNENNAKYLQEQLAFDEVYAKVLPDQKLEIVKEIQTKYNVIFVGDGLNDIEALGQANVSIAMNSGSNISKSISDFIVLDDNIKSVVDAIKIIKQATKTINANLWWSLFYNLLVIPLAGVGVIMPIISALLMGFSDLMVVNNSFIFRIMPIKWQHGSDHHD